MTLNDTVLYVTLSIPWGIAGFLAGFASAYKTILWSRSMPTMIPERPPVTPSRNAPVDPDDQPWYRKPHAWLGVGVAAIGLMTATLWYTSGQDTKHLTECTAAYANGWSDAIERRTVESQRIADGQDRLWLLFQEAVNTAPSPDLRDRFRVTINEYLEARAKAKQAQVDNPYPDPPRDVC